MHRSTSLTPNMNYNGGFNDIDDNVDYEHNDDLPERRTIRGPPESPVQVVSRPGR